MNKKFLIIILLLFYSCSDLKISSFGKIDNSEEKILPVVLSITWEKIKDISNTEQEFAFKIKFSEKMDKNATESAIYIFKSTGDIITGENPYISDALVVKPVNDRYFWSDDNKEIIVKADLISSNEYFIMITPKAKDEFGNQLDGKVGKDYNYDGKQDIFYNNINELVRVDDDYLFKPSDFISQPFIPNSLLSLSSYYYQLPNNSHPFLKEINEYILVNKNITTYEKNNNFIGVTDNGYDFGQPIRTTSLLELNFDCNYSYTENNYIKYKTPECLIDPLSLSSNLSVLDNNYNRKNSKLYYNYDAYKQIPVPLQGVISGLTLSKNGMSIDNDTDAIFTISFGINLPLGLLKNSYLIIPFPERNIKYVLPIIDNGAHSVTVKALYMTTGGWRVSGKNNYLYMNNTYLHSSELAGMFVKTENENNELYQIQNNSSSAFYAQRVSGSGDGKFNCSSLYGLDTNPCNLYMYINNTNMDFLGKEVYIASKTYYLKPEDLAENTKYSILLGGSSSFETITDILGNSLTDHNLDGSYQDNTNNAENTLEIFFPTEGNKDIFSYVTTTIINSGTLYPYAVSGINCNDGICLDPDSFIDIKTDCNGQTIERKGYSSIFFSFYTPDGDKSSYCGYNDFILDSSINKENISYINASESNMNNPIYNVSSNIIIGKRDNNTTCKGGFLTTLISLKLEPEFQECNGKYITIPTTINKGDTIIISHSIESETSNKNSKFDGNGDGILEYNSDDDLKLIFNGEHFVTEK